jgi:hypothetical protein
MIGLGDYAPIDEGSGESLGFSPLLITPHGILSTMKVTAATTHA